jgi:hypothetical protein
MALENGFLNLVNAVKNIEASELSRKYSQELSDQLQEKFRQGLISANDLLDANVMLKAAAINETKSRLSPDAITNFVQNTLPVAKTFFPEYADKKVVGAIASLYVDESLVRYGEKLGVIVLGFGEDVMEVLNSPNFKPKTW